MTLPEEDSKKEKGKSLNSVKNKMSRKDKTRNRKKVKFNNKSTGSTSKSYDLYKILKVKYNPA